MSDEFRKPNTCVIEKCGMQGWYLYTAEQCSFGTQIKWTTNLSEALMFSSEDRISTFKDKVLGNMTICVYRFFR